MKAIRYLKSPYVVCLSVYYAIFVVLIVVAIKITAEVKPKIEVSTTPQTCDLCWERFIALDSPKIHGLSNQPEKPMCYQQLNAKH